ncbi:fringe-related family protein [Salix suchowensis]|nr:fringe-related family protein [Salix suchowensis]
MKLNAQKDPDKMIWDQMRSPSANSISGSQNRTLPKLMVWLILLVSVSYVVYTLKLVSTSRACNNEPFTTNRHLSVISHNDSLPLIQNHTSLAIQRRENHEPPSAKLWEQRQNYIKIWYKPQEMRGIVWLDDKVKNQGREDNDLPSIKISGDTSRFSYTNKQGHRSAIRISRIVSETLRLGLKNVRWFVMGDDDTVFIAENLVRILRKYDHNQYYYIGSSSESHLQNIYFSYGMAYGGGGFAVSYPLAKALDKMQDRCIQRYPGLYGSDDRMQACMAELGVPLTKEVGFHQYDVYGNLFGLLAAHPVTPLVSLHHLDVVEPIFPNATRVQALRWLTVPMKLDSAGLMQQSICYDKSKRWTISVSWGFAVQIFRGVFSPREIEMPSRTFLNCRNPCQKPFVFYLSKAKFDSSHNTTVSEYSRHYDPHPACKWKMANPDKIETIVVHKKPDPHLWDRKKLLPCNELREKGSVMIHVGACRHDEISEV